MSKERRKTEKYSLGLPGGRFQDGCWNHNGLQPRNEYTYPPEYTWHDPRSISQNGHCPISIIIVCLSIRSTVMIVITTLQDRNTVLINPLLVPVQMLLAVLTIRGQGQSFMPCTVTCRDTETVMLNVAREGQISFGSRCVWTSSLVNLLI